jgi:predicted RND superfamily exporter protein
MSVGIMISFGLSMILIPAIFSFMKSLDVPEESSVVVGWLDRFLTRIENAIFNHHGKFVAIGAAMTVVLLAGAPFVRSDPQVLRWLSESTPEVKDLRFVEKNLAEFNSVELMVQASPNAFKDPAAWKKVSDLEQALRENPEVVDIDSLLPLLTYLNNLLGSGTDPGKDLFSNKALIPQLITLTTMSPEGKRAVRRFVNDAFDTVHISVRIKNSPTVPIGDTIAAIRSISDSVMGPTARVIVTGDLVVVQDQAANLIKDQLWSMCLAITIITVLMMIQLGSPMLGLLCLIPNTPPVAAVFGIMGWFGISLDSITVFAATVAVGLAVDNTIHFLTQLKREISLSPTNGIEECVRRAYRLTAKQVISWTTVTLLAFIALAVSPFRPVIFFGILGCSSLLLGLYGDLLFIQSLILWSPAIRRAIKKLIEKELKRSEWVEQCVQCPPPEAEPRAKTG